MSDLTSHPTDASREWYSVREAAALLGVSGQTIRNRVSTKAKQALRTMNIDGMLLIDAQQVESERAELLKTLGARDARTDRESEAATSDDVPALRAEVARLTGVVEGLLVAGRGHATEVAGHSETLAGLYDALRSATFASTAADMGAQHQPS